ncbi:HupE/UreJ family protein [Novosphingobium profundi]|uniref:HupE/UreJ family protein n=1 Tax=Novosphingobium profundi TaxID=1774954 RepID=UPI001BDB4B26|nr:HupE/UreJ family protein [Novosphingobium profundi]MBT0669430.1 HupE/UreJ family protein [Novosphingobium profundi]
MERTTNGARAESAHRRRLRRRRLIHVAILLLGLVLLFLGSGSARAHPMPDSTVSVRMREGGWRLHLSVPFDRLAMALISTGRIADPGPGFSDYPVPPRAAISKYVEDGIHVRARDGRAWAVKVVGITPPPSVARFWSIDVDAVPPPGTDPRKAVLVYDVVIRDVIPDVAVVALDQDWHGGLLPGHPRLLGRLTGDDRTVTITGDSGGELAALGQMVELGAFHILQGADHLAFLVTLLLSVTLVARAGQWLPQRNNHTVLTNTLWRVSAFTLGHTISLLVTSLGLLPEAGQGIEVLIALSVAVSAAHAITPIYPRREAWIAVFFGLVHGMAFATAIRELALSTGQTVLATLGFNLGIELVQLGLVALVLPALFWLRGRCAEPWIRRGLGIVALLAALWWVTERMLG